MCRMKKFVIDDYSPFGWKLSEALIIVVTSPRSFSRAPILSMEKKELQAEMLSNIKTAVTTAKILAILRGSYIIRASLITC